MVSWVRNGFRPSTVGALPRKQQPEEGQRADFAPGIHLLLAGVLHFRHLDHLAALNGLGGCG